MYFVLFALVFYLFFLHFSASMNNFGSFSRSFHVIGLIRLLYSFRIITIPISYIIISILDDITTIVERRARKVNTKYIVL